MNLIEANVRKHESILMSSFMRHLGMPVKFLEVVIRRCSVKKVSLEILQNSQKNAVPESLFYKVAGLRPATLLKKRLWHRCFPVNFTKFLRTPFIIEHLWWLLLIFGSAENNGKVDSTSKLQQQIGFIVP